MSSHVHDGQYLKRLLQRTRAWLSGVAHSRRSTAHPRAQQGRQAAGAAAGGGNVGDVRGHADPDGGNGSISWAGSAESLVDFAARVDAVSCQLGWLLARF